VDGDEIRAPHRAVGIPDRKRETMQLLVAHLFDQRATAIELTLPADPANWASRPSVREHAVSAIEEISPAYFRVLLAEPQAALGDEAETVAPDRVAG
jgi:hypothetical protein